MSRYMYAAYRKQPVIVSTTIHASPEDAPKMQRCLQQLNTQHSQWKDIHAVTAKKAALRDNDQHGWKDIAREHNDANTLAALYKKESAFSRRKKEFLGTVIALTASTTTVSVGLGFAMLGPLGAVVIGSLGFIIGAGAGVALATLLDFAEDRLDISNARKAQAAEKHLFYDESDTLEPTLDMKHHHSNDSELDSDFDEAACLLSTDEKNNRNDQERPRSPNPVTTNVMNPYRFYNQRQTTQNISTHPHEEKEQLKPLKNFTG